MSGIPVREVSVCKPCDSPGKVRPRWDPITLMRLRFTMGERLTEPTPVFLLCWQGDKDGGTSRNG